MLEQDFEKLLAAYFENELDSAGLITLRQSIDLNPSFLRRFQRELRLHSLMREAALLRLEEGDHPPLGATSFMEKVKWVTWPRIAAAALLVLCGSLARPTWMHLGDPGGIGVCVHIFEGSGATLWRSGKELNIAKDTVLQPGDRIRTGHQGQATFEVDGVGLLTLKKQTEITISPPNNDVSVSVARGMVLVEAEKRKPGADPAIFKTPKAQAEVMGTVFGLEVNAAATRVKVHEGLVRFSNRSSDRSVDVEAGQYSENGGEEPTVFEQSDLSPGALLPGQSRLLPVEDACSDGWRFLNGPYLKVEKNKRVGFLKFEVPEGGAILGATLRLTQSVDAGEGNLKAWEGSHHDWNEIDIDGKTAPEALQELSGRDGWVGLDQIVELDVSSLVKSAGTYTLLVTLESGGSNDIWFGSKESPIPPDLILTRDVQ